MAWSQHSFGSIPPPLPYAFSEQISQAQREEHEARSCEANGRLHAALRHYNQAELLITMEATAHPGVRGHAFLDHAKKISAHKAIIHQKLLRPNSACTIKPTAHAHVGATADQPAGTSYYSTNSNLSHSSQAPAYVQVPVQPPNPISTGEIAKATSPPLASAVVVNNASSLKHLPAAVASIPAVIGMPAPHARPIITAVPAYATESTIGPVAATPIIQCSPFTASSTVSSSAHAGGIDPRGATPGVKALFHVGELAEANVDGNFYVCSIMSQPDALDTYTVGFSDRTTKRLHVSALKHRLAVPSHTMQPALIPTSASTAVSVDKPSYPLLDPQLPSIPPRGRKRSGAKSNVNSEWPSWFQNCSFASVAAVVSYALTPQLWQSALQPTEVCALRFPEVVHDADRYSVRPPTARKNGHSGAGSVLRVTRYAPKVFRSIREAAGISETGYYRSLVGSEMLRGGMLGEGKSGMLFFRSVDNRFVVKTLKVTERSKFLKMLESYHKHIKRALDKDSTMPTLLSHFYDVFEIEGAEPESKSVGTGVAKTSLDMRHMILVVMNNVFYCDEKVFPLLTPYNRQKLEKNVLPLHQVFDLKGSTVKRYTSVSDDQLRYGHSPWSFGPNEPLPKCPTMKDTNLTENPINKLFVEAKTRSRVLDILRNDAQFLKGHNVMDYSLLVGIFRQQHVPDARHAYRNVAFIAVIDILQDYNMRKKMENLYKTNILPTMKNLGEILRGTATRTPGRADKSTNFDAHNISAIKAPEYCDRFLNFMECEVFAVVRPGGGTNTFDELPQGANFCTFTTCCER